MRTFQPREGRRQAECQRRGVHAAGANDDGDLASITTAAIRHASLESSSSPCLTAELPSCAFACSSCTRRSLSHATVSETQAERRGARSRCADKVSFPVGPGIWGSAARVLCRCGRWAHQARGRRHWISTLPFTVLLLTQTAPLSSLAANAVRPSATDWLAMHWLAPPLRGPAQWRRTTAGSMALGSA